MSLRSYFNMWTIRCFSSASFMAQASDCLELFIKYSIGNCLIILIGEFDEESRLVVIVDDDLRENGDTRGVGDLVGVEGVEVDQEVRGVQPHRALRDHEGDELAKLDLGK